MLDANRMGGVVEGGNGVAMEGFSGIGARLCRGKRRGGAFEGLLIWRCV